MSLFFIRSTRRIRPLLEIPVNDTITILKPFYQLVDGEVIFAFDGTNIYPITGLKHNDFIYFFTRVKALVGILYNLKITKENFSKLFSIEDVDLKCLCLELKKYSPPKCYGVVRPLSVPPRWKSR